MAARKEQSESTAKASVNMEELRELIALLRDNGLAELELEREDFRVRLRRESFFSGDHATATAFTMSEMLKNPAAATPAPAASPAPPPPPHSGAQTATASADQDLHIIASPIVGTFYRSPNPEAESFVSVGDRVSKGKVLCIIEAMKLMNEIESDADGVVVAIYPANGQPIEYGEKLFAIRV